MTSSFTRRGMLATLLAAVGLPILCGNRSFAANSAGLIHDVQIKGLAFDPVSLSVKVGDSIRWTNFDLSPHTATADDASWDCGPMKEGQSVVLAVKAGMAPNYGCSYHPDMKANLVITGA